MKYTFPLTAAEALLFLNGERCDIEPLIARLDEYQHVLIADGAWNDLHATPIGKRLLANVGDGDKQPDTQLKSINYVLGDGDSVINPPENFIELPDQNATDFEKILCLLLAKGIKSVDIYWGSGGEMDHFLGNLSVATKYGHAIDLRFFDATHCYFYTTEDCQISGKKDQTITLYPFPKALVSSQGLTYELNRHLLKQYEQQSLRNQIISDTLNLSVNGNLWLFIGHQSTGSKATPDCSNR